MATNEWAANRANQLLREFQLKGLVPNDWTFGWNRCKSAFGLCSYRKRQISLSIYYPPAATEEMVEDTILHEICHIIAGPKAGHGYLWKKTCLLYGAKPLRCGKSVENMPSKYKGRCPVCNNVYHAQRQLKNMDKRLCNKRYCLAKRLRRYLIWETNHV